jgi:hypothetical protein
MACYENGFTFSYVGDVRTSQETHMRATAAFYENGITFLYVDDIRTSQETHMRATTACYGDGFPFSCYKICYSVLPARIFLLPLL